MRRWILMSALVAGLAAPGSSLAATLNPVGTFELPIFITSAPRDPGRLLVAERKGRVIEVEAGTTRQLADFSGLVSCCESERGLLSIAPAPDFDVSGRFYAAYTGTVAAGGDEGDVHVDSFQPQASGQLAREPILAVAHVLHPNHNGGQLQFGPDGHLYISLGDGGGPGDPLENGQDNEELLGKILRIDPLPGQSPAYSIPAGNPFVGIAGRDEIWAYGLRNPWRFSFDRLTGDVTIGDVGQEEREEVDFAPSPGGGAVGGAAANYGWNCREGLLAYSAPAMACATASAFTDPVFDYPHADPGGGAAFGCSIIGGYVVRDASVPDLYGRYVYTDYCSKEIRSLVLPSAGSMVSDDRPEGLAVAKPTSFGEDACGRLYLASGEGPVYRFDGPTVATCARPAPPPVPAPRGAKEASQAEHGRLLLSAKRLRPGGSRFKVKVRLAPCQNGVGLPVQLSRNGKSFASKRLDRRCRARFLLTVAKPTPIRAFVRIGDEGERVGSRQRMLLPPKQP